MPIPLDDDWWDAEEEVMAEFILPTVEDIAVAGVVGGAAAVEALGIAGDWALVNSWAKSWARYADFDLVKGITKTTRDKISEALMEHVETGSRLDELITKLEPVFGKERAAAIATTETTRIYSEANMKLWSTAGVWGKQWVTANDELVCDICGPLDGKMIELDSEDFEGYFKSEVVGVAGPPAHVNCRCYLQPVLYKPSDEELYGPSYADDPNAISYMDPEQIMELAEQGDPYALQWIENNMPEEEVAGLLSPLDEQTERWARAASLEDPPEAAEIRELYQYPESGDLWRQTEYLETLVETDEFAYQCIDNYTGSLYQHMNELLRYGNPYDDDVKFVEEQIKLLSQVIDDAPAIKQEMMVARGMNFDSYLYHQLESEALQVGDVISDLGFMSTSIKQKVGERFAGLAGGALNPVEPGGVVLELALPPGAKGLYTGGLGDFNPSEAEFILPPGSTYQIISWTAEMFDEGPLFRVLARLILP